jgi:hypothetical protein
MKFSLAGAVILTMACFALAAKVPNSQIVDSGSFGVFINGKRVATETFKIEQRDGASVAKSEIKAQDGATQRSEMELTTSGDIVRYGWQEIQPTKAVISVAPKDEFLNEIVNGGPNEKTYSVPHLMPHSTPIVDDNFFLHREILIWRYLASGCSPKPEGLSCNTTPQQFGVLIPTQHASEMVTIGFKDKEQISLNGKDIPCTAFSMHTETGDWLLYLDQQQKLVRIVGAGVGLEVVRD